MVRQYPGVDDVYMKDVLWHEFYRHGGWWPLEVKLCRKDTADGSRSFQQFPVWLSMISEQEDLEELDVDDDELHWAVGRMHSHMVALITTVAFPAASAGSSSDHAVVSTERVQSGSKG